MRAFEICSLDSSCWGFSIIWILVVPFVLFIVGGLLYDYIGEFLNSRIECPQCGLKRGHTKDCIYRRPSRRFRDM